MSGPIDPAETPQSGGAVSASAYARYLAVALLLPLLFLVLTLQFAASQTFLRISRRQLWHATAFRLQQPANQNCDVVVFGDSTGMMGVDPTLIQARTGWTTCNLGLPYDSAALAGTRLLDNYLARNQPPRFIVLHVNATHLRAPALDEENGIIDAWLMMDESFPLTEKGRLFLAHPRHTFRFVTAVWKEFLASQPILRPDWSGSTYRHDIEEQRALRGWIAEQGSNATVVCGWQPPPFRSDAAFVESLIARYTRGPTRAIVWINPARDCDDNIARYQRDAMALGLPTLPVYDRHLFFDAFHLNTAGAERNTSELIDYLRSLH